MNESVLPSYNLGLGRPSNLGILSQFGFEESEHMHKKKKKKMKGDSDLVEPAEKKDEPDVEVEVDEKNSKAHCKKCGEKCGSMSYKKSKGKCAKCKMEAAEANYQNVLREMDSDEELRLHHGDEDEDMPHRHMDDEDEDMPHRHKIGRAHV